MYMYIYIYIYIYVYIYAKLALGGEKAFKYTLNCNSGQCNTLPPCSTIFLKTNINNKNLHLNSCKPTW